MDVKALLKPENSLEDRIISDPEFVTGVLYGKPRPGHPEGQVLYHVKHVLDNVDIYSSGEKRQKLRSISLVHDTFKYKVDLNKPRIGENHHARIARIFAERYVSDPGVLEIIELHDYAYNSWQKGAKQDNWQRAEEKASELIARLGNRLPLYLLFFKCDNLTGDKTQNCYKWFENFTRRTVHTQ